MEKKEVIISIRDVIPETSADLAPTERGSLDAKTVRWIAVNAAATVAIVSVSPLLRSPRHRHRHQHTSTNNTNLTILLIGLCQQVDLL